MRKWDRIVRKRRPTKDEIAAEGGRVFSHLRGALVGYARELASIDDHWEEVANAARDIIAIDRAPLKRRP